MKSMCHEVRRNSPSVADCRPMSSCSATTSAIATSSTSRSSSASIRCSANAARACINAGGRSKLPTWSARNGGLVRLVTSTTVPVGRPLSEGRIDLIGRALHSCDREVAHVIVRHYPELIAHNGLEHSLRHFSSCHRVVLNARSRKFGHELCDRRRCHGLLVFHQSRLHPTGAQDTDFDG